MRFIAYKIKKFNKSKINREKKSLFLDKKKSYSKIFVEQIANILANRLLESSKAKKTFDWWVCLTIPARGANLQPPIGPFLGQHGFHTMNFCNNFNTITKIFPEGLPLWVFIKLFSDKTIELQLKTPPVSFLLYSALYDNDFKGVKVSDILKIIYLKWIDNKDWNFFSHIFTVIGTLKSFKQKLLR